MNGLRIAIVGGGFAGLAAAWEVQRRGGVPIVFEAEDAVGGLAGGFQCGAIELERFYHHWFSSDVDILQLIREAGLEDQVVRRPSRTGMYFANRMHRLSTPLDLLRFSPLSLLGRLRLGILAMRVRCIRDWRKLEGLTAEEWLRSLAGDEVYRVVWEPLLRGKFGASAADLSAVWMWNKLVLRGGSRGKGGREELLYFSGGFARLSREIASRIVDGGGIIQVRSPVERVVMDGKLVTGIVSNGETHSVDGAILTPALPLIATMLRASGSKNDAYLRSLDGIQYLANVCLVLQLDRQLSDTYWLNVNDPEFPFVGVIEHTNFEPPASYAGRHIVYLSKYLPHDDVLCRMSQDEILNFALPHLQRMFPAFAREWILDFSVWRARYAQPMVTRHYSQMIPAAQSPWPNMFLASMAQIYPEDRGTTYAVRAGRAVATLAMDAIGLAKGARN